MAENDIGTRLDRAPWQRLHTTILIALGAGWMFDSFEVQMFSSAVGPLGDHFGASVFERDAVLAVWLGGILIGAVVGGRLADRFGRRRLFVATLLWYAGFTVLTGLSPNLGFVYGFRFLAALGVGAEYSIVNAAIAEFMPARVRGKANALVMNFWPLGAILAGLLAYFALDTLALSSAVSWRYMFVLGGLVALVVLVFRRRIPESPRWLASQGRTGEAGQIVQTLEGRHHRSDPDADPTSGPVTVLSTRSALAELLRHYPGRLALGSVLDLAEAFGYYGLFALMSVVVLPQIHISQSGIPIFYIIGNVGALAGGLVMASLFDRVGHRRTVGACYLLSAGAVAVLAVATQSGQHAVGDAGLHRRQRRRHRGLDLGLPDVHRAVPHAPPRSRRRHLGRDRTHRRHRRHPRPAHPRREPGRDSVLPAGRGVLAARRDRDRRRSPHRRTGPVGSLAGGRRAAARRTGPAVTATPTMPATTVGDR